MRSSIKTYILIAAAFFTINAAYAEEKTKNIFSIIDNMEKRFSINIIYNKADLKDNEGQPITLDIDDAKYRQEELIAIIAKTAGVEFEELSGENWIIKRSKTSLSDKLDQTQAKLVALEKRINEINVKINTLEKSIDQIVEKLKAEQTSLVKDRGRSYYA